MNIRHDSDSRNADSFSLKIRNPKGGTPTLTYWGSNCEYDRLTDVLLGPVENYRWLKTSSLSKKSIRRGEVFDINIATEQYEEMVSAYSSAGVNVHLLESDPELPYQVFARDSSFMTPFGAVITNMAQPWRKGENFRAIETYARLNIPIYDFITAGTFEGGDFNIVEPGCALVGWEGPEGRSQEEAVLQLKAWFQSEGWEIFTIDIDPFYVHIDLMIVMLAEKLAAVCMETTDPKVINWLKSKSIKLIPVPFSETLALGCNVVSLGNDSVLLPENAKTLTRVLRAEGFTIYNPRIDMITQGGGGLHCMCQSLRRVPV
jgi:N-dimethylarginine dimethylaminohydrolase